MASPDQPPFGPETEIECGQLIDVELHAINALSNEGMDLFARWRGFKAMVDALEPMSSLENFEAHHRWREKQNRTWNELLRISNEREFLRAEMGG